MTARLDGRVSTNPVLRQNVTVEQAEIGEEWRKSANAAETLEY